MTTTVANQNASRLAAVRTLVSGAEWTRVAAMVGVMVARTGGSPAVWQLPLLPELAMSR